jgi:hypothetical protein
LNISRIETRRTQLNMCVFVLFMRSINKLAATLDKHYTSTKNKKIDMTKIKWRTPENTNFQFYTEVPDDLIKKTTSVIKPYPYSLNEIRFLIHEPSEIIRPYLENSSNEYLIYRATQFCYFIEGGMIYSFDTQHPIARLDKENFTHFKIGNNNWSDINNIHFGYGCFCAVSWERNAFAMIGGQFALLDLTDDNEIIKHQIEEKNIDDFIQNIQVREFTIWT